MSDALIEELLTNEQLRDYHTAIQEGKSLLVEEMWGSSKAVVSALAQRATGKHLLILTGKQQEGLFYDLSFFSRRQVVNFPAWETLPGEAIAPSPDIVGERYRVLEAIASSREPLIILAGMQACLQKLIPPATFSHLYLSLQVGATHDFEGLVAQLQQMGYRQATVAADKGEFAVRGGIIDLFPVASPDPFRIEFWGDEITSMRLYDPISQRSVEKREALQVTAAQELELINASKQPIGTLFDYLGDDLIVVFDDLLALEDRYTELLQICGRPTASFATIEELMEQVAPLQTLLFSQEPIDELADVALVGEQRGGYYSARAPLHQVRFEMFNRQLEAVRWRHPFTSLRNHLFPDYAADVEVSGEELFLRLRDLEKIPDCRLHLLYGSEAEERHFQQRLLDAQLPLPSGNQSAIAYLSSGFICGSSVLLPMTELTHRYKIRRQKLRSTYHTTEAEVYDLVPGEMVVHINNGIGRYLGHEKRPDHNGVINEYLVVEYAGNSKLYVPMSQAYMISKYIGAKDEAPKLHAIGSKQWLKTREKTYQAIAGYAKDLLNIYAKRELQGGHAFPTDTPDMQAFEEEFPFVETEDQLVATAHIKRDMESPQAMDRLICGDVGYGKTEVAMRAAFKAIIDGGKQVVMLVPTTVLAMQHYDNFVERMSNFSVRIALLSRFGTAQERRKAIEGAADGTVDLLIGTHRVISRDVHFRNLGLVIIDEEHRFGVRAKEHLKKIKAGVDCLSLSATPIPRTLYMSLINVRDMSVINTPPQDRLPIKTVICEPNDHVIKNALLRELARDGQAYYIHNRVETLPGVATHLKSLLPKARVATVHGQMSAQEVDTIFHAFKSGEIDILVATTIVESGVDIPNANTIIIEKADHFGLADLYQLRGRTGRWNRRAYAYFLIRRLHTLPELSRRRLDALAESTGYGGGMKLAMRDLEIRGAGDILGTEQSGHVSAIGFHFYCKMLKRAVAALKGDASSALTDVQVDYANEARLPEEYVNSPNLRMEIYQRLGEAATWEEIDDIIVEIEDRYGPLPTAARHLYHISRLRLFAAKHGFTALKIGKESATLYKKINGKSVPQHLPLPKCETPEALEKHLIAILAAVA